MINLVLCGGSGTRLWPLSRTALPKQFVRLFNECSLFQETILRNQKMCSESIIVSNKEQYFLALDQLQQLSAKPAQFLLEPVGRNTAPAIALACLALLPDELVLVTPSDHLVKNRKAYEQAVTDAMNLAKGDHLVTFGIKPTYAETGFGYIESSGQDVLSFKEKPSKEKAEEYLKKGNYYWNSGMFCFKSGVFLEELKQYSPSIYQSCLDAFINLKESSRENLLEVSLKDMEGIPEDSIDFAVMEKSSRVKVIPCDIDWSDLGSFDALYTEVKEESLKNAVIQRSVESKEPICIEAKNNLIVCQERQVSLIGVDDLLVVDTADALLISKKGHSQQIKEVVEIIKKQAPDLAKNHRLVYRPWGTYEVLLDTALYKIKRIVVNMGCKLSLQKHFHRNEHWIVVSGTATVTVSENTFLVRPNESTYIQMGELHRLENQGKIDLVMIEVQVGEYTGEDDIVRVEDVYGRLE